MFIFWRIIWIHGEYIQHKGQQHHKIPIICTDIFPSPNEQYRFGNHQFQTIHVIDTSMDHQYCNISLLIAYLPCGENTW